MNQAIYDFLKYLVAQKRVTVAQLEVYRQAGWLTGEQAERLTGLLSDK